MGKEKEGKEKLIMSPEETATLLRELADRISGVSAEFEQDQTPTNGAFQKLKLSLKRAKGESNHFVVKCKIKPEYPKDAKEEPEEEEAKQEESV